MSDVYHEVAYYDDYPAMPEDIARYLVEQKVNIVGVDMCSPDREPFEPHRILLSGDVLIMENLTNLGELAGKTFEVYALPIRVDIDAAPASVIAVVKDQS
jgi:arylformamidase